MKKLNIELALRAPEFKSSETEPKGRDPFQRDLGRIIHSASFRRLQAKTQVLGTGEGDFHRTRLTHTLEVGQIGRGIIWELKTKTKSKLSEFLPSSELIEAICYAHDLGHPPYGHSGERALHERMSNMGGFEGNAQTLRILTKLEKHTKGKGICPSRRLLLGILKYPAPMNAFEVKKTKPPKCYYTEEREIVEKALSIFSKSDIAEFCRIQDQKTLYKTLDCSIMELADDIAYGIHDLEDGIGRKILVKDEILEKLQKAFQENDVKRIRNKSADHVFKKLFDSDSCNRKEAISDLVNFFITSVELKKSDKFDSSFLNVQAKLPSNLGQLLEFIKIQITYNHIVKRREVQTLEYKGEKLIGDLFDALALRPLSLIGEKNLISFNLKSTPDIQKKYGSKSLEDIGNEFGIQEKNKIARTIADYISGMTNPYAEKFHRRLFEPGYGSSTDEL